MGNLVDMSEFQPSNTIDWNTFSKNVDVLFFRIQYGSSHPDKEYKNHVTNAKKYNKPFHSYAFPEFISVQDARVEADDASTRQDPASLSLGIDLEPEYDIHGNPAGITKLPYQVRLDGIKAYVDELRKKGVKKVGAYIDQRIYETWGINTIINLFDYIWIPAYGVDNGQVSLKPKYPCDLHQYTSRGKVAGYNGYLDLNQILNKSLDYFTGKITATAQSVTPPPTTTDGSWKKENGIWYYYVNGVKKTNTWIQYKNNWYFVNPDGSMKQGWLMYKNNWYYLNPAVDKGEMMVGWIHDNGKTYYCNPAQNHGEMLTGTQTIDGKVYNFKVNGELIQ